MVSILEVFWRELLHLPLQVFTFALVEERKNGFKQTALYSVLSFFVSLYHHSYHMLPGQHIKVLFPGEAQESAGAPSSSAAQRWREPKATVAKCFLSQ